MPPTDAELVPGLIAQEEPAINAFVDRYWRSAYGVALQLTGDPAGAEDVAQEAILAALRGVATLREGASLRAWFFQILRNTAAKQHLSQQRRAAREEASVKPADEPEPSAVLEKRQEEALVREHLGRLSPKLRHALALRFLEGLPLAEIAEVLEVPRETVSSRIRRGLESLRASLQPALAVTLAALPGLLERSLSSLETPAAPTAASLLAAFGASPGAAAGAEAAEALGPPPALPTARKGALALAALAALIGGAAAVGLLASDPAPAPPTVAQVDPVRPASAGPSLAPRATGAASPTPGPSPSARQAADAAALRGQVRVASLPALEGAWVARVDPRVLDLRNLFADAVAARRALGRARYGWNVPPGSTPIERDGSFTLDLPAGQHWLALGARGARTRLVQVTAPRAEPLAVELTPLMPATLELELVDAQGEPYADCWVTLDSPARATPWVDGYADWARALERGERAVRNLRRSALAPVQLDAQGRATLTWPAGDYARVRLRVAESTRLRDRCPFLMGSLEQRIATLSLAGVTRQRVTLSWRSRSYRGHRGQVEVHVADAAGQPVPGAWVQVLRHQGDRTIAGLRQRTALSHAWVTGRDGRVRIRGVEVGAELFVAARAGDRWTGLGQRLRVEDPARLHVERLTLDRPFAVGHLRLRLIDAATGRPPASSLQVARGGGTVQFQRAWTFWCEAKDGQAELGQVAPQPAGAGELRIVDVPPGTWVLHVEQPRGNRTVSFLPGQVEVEVRAGETTSARLTLRRGATLRGVVRLDGAVAFPGGAAYAVQVIDPQTRRVVAQPTLDPQNRFAASGLDGARAYHVVVHGLPGALPALFSNLSPEREHTLDLPTRVGLTLSVRDADDRPISGAAIRLRGSKETRVDARGVARWRGRLRRATSAEVGAYGYTWRKVRVQPGPDGRAEQRVTLAPAPKTVAVEGQLRGATGAPLADVRLRLRGHLVARSDAQGRFAGRVFADGANAPLTCEHPDLPRQTIQPTPGASLTFTLRRGGRVRVTLEGNAAAVRRVALRSGKRRARARRGPDGAFTTPLVLPGTWTVALLGRRKVVLLEHEVTVQADRDTAVTLQVP